MASDAKLYREVSEPRSASWTKQQDEVRESLEALALFGVRQPLPMVLSLMREYRAGSIRLKLLKTALRVIEDSYYATTAIASLPSSGGVSSMYARHARDLKSATTAQAKMSVVNDLILKLRASRPTSEQFVAGFTLLRASERFTQRRRLVHYTLKRLYRYDNPGTPLDFEKMTIEHLAPQSAGKLDEEVVASVGNLILVDQRLNAKLGNKPFSKKVPILKQQNTVAVESRVLQAKTWGAKAIEQRSDELGEHAYQKVWAF